MSDFSWGVGIDDLVDQRNRGGVHPNPINKFLDGYTPRTLKKLLGWAEYLYCDSTHIYAALNKLADYSITDIIYSTESKLEKERHEKLLEKVLAVKGILKAASRDRGMYGNSFISLYLPFTRHLTCLSCQTMTNIRHVNYKYKAQTGLFSWACPDCKQSNKTGIDQLKDTKVADMKRINVIRWDPKSIDIDHNPITGERKYYYNIPIGVKEKVKLGVKSLINSMPKGFLQAVRDKKVFEFADQKIFHMRVDAPAGVDSAWGLPPLVSTLRPFLFVAALRKANEAIALDYLVPFRVLHPAQSTGNSDPFIHMNMSRWVDETKANIQKWRRDPLHIQFSPFPLGTTQMGGQGRTLMCLPEVESAENNILAAMGIPREFLFGGLSFAGSSVTLRMLENQLLSQTRDLLDLLQWIGDACSDFLGWTKIHYEMTPFKLIDDVQQKQILMGLAGEQGGGMVSKTTVLNAFNQDIAKERKMRKQETLDELRFQAELSSEAGKMQNTLAAKAKAQAASMQGPQQAYDTQQIMTTAQSITEQLVQMDPGMRSTQLDSLKVEDPVMHAVVIQQIRDMQQQQVSTARQAGVSS